MRISKGPQHGSGLLKLEQLYSCLRTGDWFAINQSETSRRLGTWLPTTVARERPGCRAGRARMEDRRWRGGHDGCDAALEHPAFGTFRGRFEGSGVIQLVLLGDSLALNLASVLNDLLRANRHLRAIREPKHVPVAIIPSSEQCEGILRALPFSPVQPGGSDAERHVLLISIGTWYNLLPTCYFRTSDGAWMRNTLADYGTCPKWLARPSLRAAIRLNHSTHATQPLHFKHFGYGDYAYTRQASGSTTISEFAADVGTMLAAVNAWQGAASELRRVVWLESMPQHFGFGTDNSTVCSAKPHVHMPPGAAAQAPLPPAARSLCAVPLRENATLRDCDRPEAIHDWRNRVAAPLLTAHGMPVVPLAAALGQRGELHPGGGDCSHWCHASEASLHMARATLNVLAALL